MCPKPSSWGYLMWRALVGSGRLGSGCLILRADTRENPAGKNVVMTLMFQAVKAYLYSTLLRELFYYNTLLLGLVLHVLLLMQDINGEIG